MLVAPDALGDERIHVDPHAPGGIGPEEETASQQAAPPVTFSADEVRFDTRVQALEAVGHVHVEEPPFHLTSDALRLRRVPIGMELQGDGRLAFCPCLGAPLAVRFRGATVAPPHDVILREPVLEVFGVPIAWAPAFWLRDAGRPGVLPPIVEWRGSDGLRLGEGVHVPWIPGDTQRGLDVRAAGYVTGGALVDVALRTSDTETRVVWDDLRGEQGIGVGARGATSAGSEGVPEVAWVIDLLRGVRAVHAVTDLDVAARPFDRATAQAAWRAGGWTFASSVRDVAPRGSDLADLGAAGPIVAVRRSDGLGGLGAYDATVEAGAVRTGAAATTTFARAEGDASLAARPGIVGTSVMLHALGDVADDGTQAQVDGAAQVRARLAAPLVRGFPSSDSGEPWVHLTEPRVELAALATQGGGGEPGGLVAGAPGSVLPVARGMSAPAGGAWVAVAGWKNQVGRAGRRESWDLDASGGAVGDGHQALPSIIARAVAAGDWVAARADFARVFATGDAAEDGGALLLRARLGLASSLHAAVHLAERDGVDPVVARALVDAPLEPASGYLAVPGWSGGARLAIPLGRRVAVRGGVDVDLGAPASAAAVQTRLVAAAGGLELHDPCGCVAVRATASHRVGRDGVDAWITVDLTR
jgi:hypothetical protein